MSITPAFTQGAQEESLIHVAVPTPTAVPGWKGMAAFGVLESDGSISLQISIKSGGSSGGGSSGVGTLATPNVSVLKDSASNNEATIDASGRLAILTDGAVATAVSQTSGLAQDTGGSGAFGFFSSMLANLRLIAARLLTIGGNVGGKTATVDVTPTVTASSAYASNNVVGGVMTFSSALLSAGTGILQSSRLKIKSGQSGIGFKLYLFKSNPTNGTYTDKTNFVLNASDLAFAIGPFVFANGDTGGGPTLFTLPGIGEAVAPGATTLYGILVTTGTPTFSSTSDVTVTIGVLQD